jgi:hypothetical protein
MALLNKGVNIGHWSKFKGDKCKIDLDIETSVSPLLYRLNPNQINNCDACLSVFGPRSSHNGYGDSTTVGHRVAPAQDLVDVESILSNRNVIASKCRDGKVNDIDVTKFQLQHARVCNDYLDPVATHLTNPAANYRCMSINRFYDLPTNPQAVIYWDAAVNTQLEAKDNYRERAVFPYKFDPTLPREFRGQTKQCKYKCDDDCPQGSQCRN